MVALEISALDIDILKSAIKRGRAGILKEELMRELSKPLSGIAYDDFIRHIEKLVSAGLATMEELGPDDFTLYATEKASEVLKNV